MAYCYLHLYQPKSKVSQAGIFILREKLGIFVEQ